jgi:hypothetical protein
MSWPSTTLTGLALRFGVPRAHLADVLGVTAAELQLLDCGHAHIPDSDLPEVARRIGSSCTAEDVRLVLVQAKTNPPRGLYQRIGRASDEFAASGSREPTRFLNEYFPDPIERRQVRGPNLLNRFEWHRALVRVTCTGT